MRVFSGEIITRELSRGQDYVWYQEFNIVALSSRLDAAGRERALDELLARWRRELRETAA